LGKIYAVGGSGVHQRLFEQKFDSDIQCGDVIETWRAKFPTMLPGCPIYTRHDPSLDIAPPGESTHEKTERLMQGFQEGMPVVNWVNNEIKKEDPDLYWEFMGCNSAGLANIYFHSIGRN